MLPQEYREYLNRHLSALEKATAAFSGIDERIDYTNILLTKLLNAMSITIPSQPPTQLPDVQNVSVIQLRNKASFRTGTVTIETANVAAQLSSSNLAIPDGFYVTVLANPDNMSNVRVGSSKADAEGSQAFDGLQPGLAVAIRVKAVDMIWVCSATAGDKVSWLIEKD